MLNTIILVNTLAFSAESRVHQAKRNRTENRDESTTSRRPNLFIGAPAANDTDRNYVPADNSTPSAASGAPAARDNNTTNNNDDISVRIFNGVPYNIEDYPWFTRLNVFQSFTFCGGVLLANNYVLTAAHCLASFLYNEIRPIEDQGIPLGPLDLVFDEKTNVERERRQITEAQTKSTRYLIIPNKEEGEFKYFLGNDQSPNDYGLVKMDEPVKSVKTAKFPSKRATSGVATIIGFGFTESGYLANQLHGVKVFLKGDEDCRDLFGFASLHPSMLCAGGKDNRNSCRGDSGGPLFDENNVTIGLVSFGLRDCGMKGKPAVYADVLYGLPWIRRNAPGARIEIAEELTSRCTDRRQRLFVHHRKSATFAEASEICRSNPVPVDQRVRVYAAGGVVRSVRSSDIGAAGNLATVRNPAEQELLLNMVGNGLQWLGSTRSSSTWSNTFVWNSPPSINMLSGKYVKWFKTEPNGIYTAENCAALNQWGVYDYSCERKFTFVCEFCGDAPVMTSECPSGTERAFVHHTEPQSWSDAAAQCQANVLGGSDRIHFLNRWRSVSRSDYGNHGNLATVRSKGEQQRLLNIVGAAARSGLQWLGSTRSSPTSNTFVWNSPPSIDMLSGGYVKWFWSEPNGLRISDNCAALNQGGVYDYSCAEKFTFVCEFCARTEGRRRGGGRKFMSRSGKFRYSRGDGQVNRNNSKFNTRVTPARSVAEASSPNSASSMSDDGCFVDTISCLTFYAVLCLITAVVGGVALVSVYAVKTHVSSHQAPLEEGSKVVDINES